MRSALAALVVFELLAAPACSRRETAGAPAEQGNATSARPPPSAAHAKQAPVVTDPSSAPRGYRVMTVGGVAPTSKGNAVVLTDEDKTVGVLIFVGGTEALSLALRLQHRRYDRPLTHDLLDSVVKELDAKIVGARVDKLENDVYHGTLVVRTNGRIADIDARPSDALALAVGASAPIFVADQVIDKAGIDLETLDLQPPDALGRPKEADENAGVEL